MPSLRPRTGPAVAMPLLLLPGLGSLVQRLRVKSPEVKLEVLLPLIAKLTDEAGTGRER